MDFITFRRWFNERFSSLLGEKIHDFTSNSKSTAVSNITSHIKSIANEGKRFRPYLVYAASNLDTENSEKYFLLFASVELLHIFALIHDDIMDEADTRHGVICAHRKFSDTYGETIGEGIGILLGDIVFAWAYECLIEYNSLFPDSGNRIYKEFTSLVSEVIHGQMLDILSPAQEPLTEKEIVEKMTLKTARYTFVQPLRLGFVVRGDEPNDQKFAEDFGLALGIGFQLQDDLLDMLPAEDTGKTQFSDIQNGNQTLLSNYILQSNLKYKEEFKTFFKKPLDKTRTESLLLLIRNSGAIEYVKELAQTYFNKARTAVEVNRNLDASKWIDIIDMVHQRKK